MASQDTEAALFGTFGPDIPAKSTFGASLKPLFRQFHNGVLGSSPPGNATRHTKMAHLADSPHLTHATLYPV